MGTTDDGPVICAFQVEAGGAGDDQALQQRSLRRAETSVSYVIRFGPKRSRVHRFESIDDISCNSMMARLPSSAMNLEYRIVPMGSS